MALPLIAVFTLSLFGWGRAFRSAFHLPRGTWPATAALGMASLLFLGGLLNLARWAYPWTLAGAAGAGILFCIPGLKRASFQVGARGVMVLLVASLILGFTVWTQLPPRAYNFHDDFEKYFAHAVRMVETGTVYGSPLSAIGSETLGGQAFLQGFIVAFFPIRYINGFDSVFALFLCLMLASEFTGPRRGLSAMTLISMLCVVVINPQYVNVSALYSGSAIVMALAAVCGDPREMRPDSSNPNSAAAGLLCAALISLKTSFALFVAFLLLFRLIALGVRWSVRTGLFSIAFLSPWLLLHSPHYLAALRVSRGVQAGGGPLEISHLAFLSFERLGYGSSIAAYTLLMAAIGLSTLLALWAAKKQAGHEHDSPRWMAVFCAAGLATYLTMLLSGPAQFGRQHTVRYCVPVAIGLAPALFGSAARYVDASRRFRPRALRILVPQVVAVLSLLAFLPSLRDRIHQELKFGSALAFSWLANDPDYLAYNWQVLYGPVHEKVKAMQQAIPSGEAVVAWMNTPFYLDYSRNRIIDAEPAGLAAGWGPIPRVRYLIWEYNGYATRSEDDLLEDMRNEGALERLHATRTLEFLHRVEAWAEQGEVLYDDGDCKVVRLAK